MVESRPLATDMQKSEAIDKLIELNIELLKGELARMPETSPAAGGISKE